MTALFGMVTRQYVSQPIPLSVWQKIVYVFVYFRYVQYICELYGSVNYAEDKKKDIKLSIATIPPSPII